MGVMARCSQTFDLFPLLSHQFWRFCWVCFSVSGFFPSPSMSLQPQNNLTSPYIFAIFLLFLYGAFFFLASIFFLSFFPLPFPSTLQIQHAVYLFMSQTINLSIAYIYRSKQDKQHNAFHFIERQISWMTLTYVGWACRANQWPC